MLSNNDPLTSSIPDVLFKKSHQAKSGIDILTLQSLYDSPPVDHYPNQPHRVDFHCLLYIERGNGQHFIDFNYYDLEPETCLLINRFQVHAFDFDNQPQGYLLLFTDDFIETVNTNIRNQMFSPFQRSLGYSPIIKLNHQNSMSFNNLLQELVCEHQSDQADSLMQQLLFSSLLLRLNKSRELAFSHRLTSQQLTSFSYFMSLLEGKLRQFKNAADYAYMMNMSYKSLNLLCKAVTQKTAKCLIDEAVILEAKRQLVIRHCQIQTLAFDLGFDELSNFVKYFKKHTGVTPAKFKKSL